MPLNLESLDDQVLTEETPLFNAGQISNSRPANLPPNAAWLLQNCEIGTTGRLITRPGTDRIGDSFGQVIYGMAYFKTPSYAQLIAFPYNGSTSVRLKLWNGTAWGDPGGVPVGNFSQAPICICQGENATKGVPTLYMTQASTTSSTWNGAVFSLISTGTITQPAYCAWHTDRLVLAGADEQDTVSFSQYLDGETFDAANWDLRVGAGDGDPITGLTSWTNSLLAVFKQHSIWTIDCNPLLVANDVNGNVSAFVINQVHKQIGCLANATAVQVGQDIFFLSDSGVRSLLRTQASDSRSEIGPALSDPVHDIIERINLSKVHLARAIYWQNKYLLSIPLDSSDYPNYILVYNTLTQSWSGYWTNWTAMAFTRWVDNETPKLVIGNSDGSVAEFLDYVDEGNETTSTFEDQGSTYSTVIESRAFTLGDQDSPKTGLFTRLEFVKSQGDVTVSAIAGRNETPQVLLDGIFSTSNEGITLPVTLPVLFPAGGVLRKSLDLMSVGQWRDIRIRVESEEHKVALNKVSVGAFLDSYILQE